MGARSRAVAPVLASLLLVLAWLWPVGEAQAQSVGCGQTNCFYPTLIEASAGCSAAAAQESQANGGAQTQCGFNATLGGPDKPGYVMTRWVGYWMARQNHIANAYCPAGQEWDGQAQKCVKPCAFDDPALPSGHVQCSGIDWSTCPHTVCVDECGYDQPGGGLTGYVIDGTRWVLTTGWMPRGQSCTVGTGTPGLSVPPSDSDGDGTSDGNDAAPNNPGEGGGSGQDGAPQGQDGSKACGGPGQPACDGSNEGSGKGNTSGGGGNCQTPPSSTGDAILAQIAYQAWATRCAVEGQGKGGTGTGSGTGDANGNGVPDVLETGPGLEAGETPALGTIGEDAWGGVDTGGWLGGGACPGLPTEISSLLSAQACQQADILKGFLKLLGLVFAGVIIGRAAAGSA